MNDVFCLNQYQANILVGLRIEILPGEAKGHTLISIWDGGDNLWKGYPSEFDAFVASMVAQDERVDLDDADEYVLDPLTHVDSDLDNQ